MQYICVEEAVRLFRAIDFRVKRCPPCQTEFWINLTKQLAMIVPATHLTETGCLTLKQYNALVTK